MSDIADNTLDRSVSKEPVPFTLFARAGAEFLGSFMVFTAIFVVTAILPAASTSVVALLLIISLMAAMAYGAVSALFGRISGGQINPAVTFAAALASRIGWLDALVYIIAQLLGGLASAAAVAFTLPESSADKSAINLLLSYMTNIYDQGSKSSLAIPTAYANFRMTFGMGWSILLECMSLVLIIGVYMANSDERGLGKRWYPLGMGLAYGFGTMLTFGFDHASLNPAKATGIAIMAKLRGLTDPNPLPQLWVFWLVPLLAAALVAFVVIVYSSVHANDAAIYAEISQEPFDQEDEDSSFEGDQDQDGRKDQAATTAKADKNADSDSVETKPTFDSIVVEAGKPQADDQAEGRSDASDESIGPVSSASDSAGDPSSDGLAF